MPSLDHEVLVELFRNRPELAFELLTACAGIPPMSGRAELGSIDLSQVVSVEYRADAVVLLRDDQNEIAGAVVVEVQLNADPGKHMSWPQYVTALRARLAAPVVLLVLTHDAAVARWARQPIETGHPGFALVPIVVELEDVPRVDEIRARESPEFAVLSALGHREVDTALAAREGFSVLTEERARLYWDIVLDALPNELLEAVGGSMIKNYAYKSEFARFYYGEGRVEGRRDSVLQIARARFPEISRDDEAAVNAISDLQELEALVVSVAGATTYAAFQRLLKR